MRQRLDDMREARDAMLAGEAVRINDFVHFAEGIPSRESLTDEQFQAELQAFEMFYATFENTKPEDIQARYQAVVQFCISCHERHCPGPLRAIRTLEFENPASDDFKLYDAN